MKKERFAGTYIILLFVLMFIYGMSSQAIGTLISRIIEHYGIHMAKAGLLSSFTNVGNFIAIFLVAILVGRINKMVLMGAGLFFYAVSIFLISVAPPFGFILICFSLIGVFGATFDTLSNSLAADFKPDKVSSTMSLLHGFFGLGGLSGPIVMENLAGKFSWMQVYSAASFVYFFYVIVYAIFVRRQWTKLSVHISHEKQTKFGLSDMVQFFKQKRHVLLWMAVFFYGGNQSTITVWIKRYVETHLNAPVWGAYALSAMWLGTTISRLVISPAIKASSPRKICAGNIISAVVLALGLWNGSAIGITAASLLVGLSSGLTLPLVVAICCEWFPQKTAFGTLMAFMAFYISCVVFPPLSGLVGDSFGIPWGVAVCAASALFAAVFSGFLDAELKTGKVY